MIFDTEVAGTTVANVTVIDPVVALHVIVSTVAFVFGVSTIAPVAHDDGNVNFTCVAAPEAPLVIATSSGTELITLSIKALPAHVFAPEFMISVNSSDDNLKASVRVETGVITIASSQAVVAVTP